MQTVLYPYHAVTAGMLSAMFWWLPQPDYWQIWTERSMRSNVLPHITGI